MLLVGNVITALEHHVLKKMRKTRFANFLTGRTHVVSNIYMHHGIAMVFVYNKCKAIWQYIFFVRNYYFATCFGNFFYQLCLSKSGITNDKKCSSKHPYFLFHYIFFKNAEEKPGLPKNALVLFIDGKVKEKALATPTIYQNL